MGQTLVDGIWLGDRFNGNYGAFGESPFGMGPVKRSWRFWVQTASIDTYLTPEGLQRTLELLELPVNIPIAADSVEFKRLVDEGATMVIQGDPYMPSMYQLWIKKHSGYKYAGNGMQLWMGAQTIIHFGVNHARQQVHEAMDRYLKEMRDPNAMLT